MTQDTTKTVASPSGLQRVTVLGTGVLGAQIAFQCAFTARASRRTTLTQQRWSVPATP